MSLAPVLRYVPTIAPVAYRALLAVTGSHASEFLNGVAAVAIRDPHKPCYTAFMQPQGRVLYDAFIYTHRSPDTGEPGYIIEYDSRLTPDTPALPDLLKRYVLRSKVKLRDVSHEWDVWHAWGSRDTERFWDLERKWNWAKSGAIEPVWDVISEWPWGTADLAIHDRRAPGLGIRFLVKKGDKPAEASTHDVETQDAYTLHRIMHGVPEGFTDMPPTHAFPMESNLDIMGGLDFRKGCYVGQELTVRTYHTGAVRKRILPVVIHKPDEVPETASPSESVSPLPADTIIEPRVVEGVRTRGGGKLLSNVHGLGLALLRLDQVEAADRGEVTFHMSPEGHPAMRVSHWWPVWWPAKTH
ncbi:Aminomethyltransferase folate-binding domain-containing protein [Fistulina hepatica ATCC 64428]|uniref:Aminomethyltransferase folate-binding domain-containing protein n=1 Tax=Fistulina hepatica ATCC 64428 TaxID=1128425 RepID=A0A0D7AJV3_9AGAR|nr:Aminomethyltransferase folate-binding domain-containing protein [Fistulina hepatica ATCC 64428]